jgi:L-alanine-DL-glutamate epimerase-like enolase superfamily enzyme
MGHFLNRSVSQILGGAGRDRIQCTYIVGLKDVAETVQEAIAKYRAGYRVLKIKIGHDDQSDFEKVRLLRTELDSDAIIRVDANCA